MRYMIAGMFALALTGFVLWAAAALEFSSVKRAEKVKITDVTIAIRVPVVRDGSVRPIVPEELRELRKVETITYSDTNALLASHAIVVMIVPFDYVTEFMKRASEYPDVQVVERVDLAAARDEFVEGEAKLTLMEEKVEYALTPAAVLGGK